MEPSRPEAYINFQPNIELKTPDQIGEYTLLIYAIDEQGKASSHQVPFIVE
jgi:hypothetical protein